MTFIYTDNKLFFLSDYNIFFTGLAVQFFNMQISVTCVLCPLENAVFSDGFEPRKIRKN
jgi:hypothetical protein